MKTLFKIAGSLFALILILSFLWVGGRLARGIFANFSFRDTKPHHLAGIEITGTLIRAYPIVEQLRDLAQDNQVDAVIVRVNSPGGLVSPSQEIYEAIRELDQKKPVYISMGSLAASGGYYVALGGRKIFANSGTLTGSVGVIVEFANMEKLYQWAKVERFSIKSGKFKDSGSPFRAMRSDEREYFESLVQNIYREFRKTVIERRQLTEDQANVYLDGRVLTGTQAVEANLVDSLGTLEQVIAEAKKQVGLPEDAEIHWVEPKHGLLYQLLVGEDEESSEGKSVVEWLQHIPLRSGWRVLMQVPADM